MIFEVQTYDTTDNTAYYETVEDVMSCEDARDVIAEKYPNRKVISVQERKTPDELAQPFSWRHENAL
jgi:hypothetical protein